MPVLDVRTLSRQQLKTLSSEYDRLCNETLKPLADLRTDDVRCQIDQAISAALEIPELGSIRELLDREPGLTAKGIAVRPTQVELDIDLEPEEETQEELY